MKPFLRLVREHNLSSEIIRNNSYSVQAESFLTFLDSGIAAERYDIPVANEKEYEVSQFIKTTFSLFKMANDKNYVFLNAQCIFNDTVTLLRNYDNEKLNNKLVFLFNTNGSQDFPKSVMSFIEESSKKENFLHLPDEENTGNYDNLYISQPENNFLTDEGFRNLIEKEFNLLYNTLHNNRIFMCHEQLKFFVQWVLKNIHSLNYSKYQKRILNFEVALDCIDCHMEDEAILLFNDIIESNEDDDYMTAALYNLARIFYIKKSAEFAKKYALQAKARLTGKQYSPYFALLSMLDFQFSRRSETKEVRQKYMDALEQLDSHGFINNYISTGLTIPWSLINDPESRTLIDYNIDSCMDIAKKTGNMHLYSTACHWKGIIHSHYGERDDAMYWYNECNRIRTDINELGPLMNIRNGLSYESMCRALYKDAYNLVNDIVKNLYNLNDYSRIIDCLKNISYALFYSHHYEEAERILDLLLSILHMFNMEEQTNNSFLPTTNDILIFKTIINLDKNDKIRSKINYYKIAQTPETITSEDKPLLNFIKALLYAEDRLFEQAEDCFEKSIQEFRQITNSQAHKIVFINYEFAKCMQKLKRPDLAEKYMSQGHKIAAENKFEYYTKNKESLTVEEYLDGIEKYDDLKIDIAFLEEKAEKESLLTQLHKRIHDYQFLSKIRSSDTKTKNIKKYIENSMMAVFEYTLADGVFLCEISDSKFSTVFKSCRQKNIKVSAATWKTLFEESNSRDNAQLIYKQEHELFFANISQFDFKFAVAIIPSKQNPLTSDYINTLNIALSTIQSQLTIFKQDENLLFLSTTDQLSLLHNRHALQQYISMESDKIRRYEQRKSTRIQTAVAFLDLDNFKFYNDTFGHTAGDLLISSFAKLLTDTCRQIDFISRFGGDEFVIVMADTNVEESKRVYQRLEEALIKKQHFIPDLEKLLGTTELNIPKNRYLGFSMGVSTNYDVNDCQNLEEVMRNADKALYYSKEHGKGSLTIWSEIKKSMLHR